MIGDEASGPVVGHGPGLLPVLRSVVTSCPDTAVIVSSVSKDKAAISDKLGQTLRHRGAGGNVPLQALPPDTRRAVAWLQ